MDKGIGYRLLQVLYIASCFVVICTCVVFHSGVVETFLFMAGALLFLSAVVGAILYVATGNFRLPFGKQPDK